MLQVGDKGYYHAKGGGKLAWGALGEVLKVEDGVAYVEFKRTVKGDVTCHRVFGASTGEALRLFKPADPYLCPDVGSCFKVTERKYMFDFKSMTLPVTLSNSSGTMAVIEKVSDDGQFAFGYTKENNYGQTWAKVWDRNGDVIYGLSKDGYPASYKTKLVQPKSEAEKLYDALDADAKGILSALNNNYKLSVSYLTNKGISDSYIPAVIGLAAKKEYK
jgi:hypothetical protein